MKIDSWRRKRRNIALFAALFATALALGAALAHLLELPNKLRLPVEEYLVVQQIYFGWDRLGYLIAAQFAAIVASAFCVRHNARALRATLAALACLLVAQAIFWTLTYPINVATANWTMLPDDWTALRNRWEFSHAAGALFQAGAMAALIVAALSRGRLRGPATEPERAPADYSTESG